MGTFLSRFVKSVFLLCITLSCLTVCAYADEPTSGSCGTNATWTYDASTQTVTISGTGAISDFDGTDPRWERYYSKIKRVIIGDGITHICANAFLDDVRIVDITFLGDMPTFGDNCFAHISASAWYPTNNSTWTFPVPGNHGATDLFFQKNGIESTHCGDNATWQYDSAAATLTIGGYGPIYEFYDEQRQPWASFREQVQYVIVGENITHIGWNAFSYMTGLEILRCTGDMPTFSYNTTVDIKVQGRYPDGNKTWDLTKPQKGSTNGGITWSVYQGYSGSCGGNTTWNFDPATGVLTIAGSGRMNAYEQWENPWRFYYNQIKKVVVKGTVEHIGDFSFFRCFQATEIIIEDGVKSVGRNGLQNTKISSIHLPDSIESMGMVSLGSCHNLTTLKLSANLKKISEFFVTDCPSLKTIYVGAKVTEVDIAGFANLEGTSIIFTGNAPQFHSESFRYSYGRIYYPKDDPTWTNVVGQTYGGSAITWIAYDPNDPENLPEPDNGIPGGNTNEPTVGNGWTYHSETGEFIIYPGCNTQEVYLLITGGQMEPIRSVIIEGGFTEIPDAMFAAMTNLESVQLCEGITYIGANAFADCTALREINLPEGLESIEMGAFFNAAALESIVFPSTLVNICDGAFELCTALSHIQFTGSAPVVIGENAFLNVCAAVSYPEDDESWSEVIGQQFGGSLTWPGQTASDSESTVDQLLNADNGSQVVITQSTVTEDILEAAKGKDIDLVLSMGSYLWTINGADITGASLTSIDLSITFNTQNIPTETIRSIAGDADTMQLSLTHNGEFGFNADLTVYVGPANAGQTAQLYYYTGTELTHICSAVVDASGGITLPFSHASDYVLIIDRDKPQSAFLFLIIPAATLTVAAAFLLLRKKKTSQ